MGKGRGNRSAKRKKQKRLLWSCIDEPVLNDFDCPFVRTEHEYFVHRGYWLQQCLPGEHQTESEPAGLGPTPYFAITGP